MTASDRRSRCVHWPGTRRRPEGRW
jgi:hypothetical protein